MPTYKTALKSNKPQPKTVLQRTEDSVETLKRCFLCTDWSIFHNLELNEATETITNYITRVDTVVSKNNILHFPNNKPYGTKEVKACINKKKFAFKNKDEGSGRSPKETDSIAEEGGKHRATLEESVNSVNTKRLWNCMKA